jgi:hypothetical protein
VVGKDDEPLVGTAQVVAPVFEGFDDGDKFLLACSPPELGVGELPGPVSYWALLGFDQL